MEAILAELTKLFGSVSAEAQKRAAEAVVSHERIFVYAAGRSGLMLKAFAMRLAQLGKTVYVAGETITPAIGQGDLLILASASGSTPSVCRNAAIARGVGADLLIISANSNSALTADQPADILLPAATKDSAAGSRQIMGSLFEQALLLFCDSVVAMIATDRSAMRGRHANLE